MYKLIAAAKPMRKRRRRRRKKPAATFGTPVANPLGLSEFDKALAEFAGDVGVKGGACDPLTDVCRQTKPKQILQRLKAVAKSRSKGEQPNLNMASCQQIFSKLLIRKDFHRLADAIDIFCLPHMLNTEGVQQLLVRILDGMKTPSEFNNFQRFIEDRPTYAKLLSPDFFIRCMYRRMDRLLSAGNVNRLLELSGIDLTHPIPGYEDKLESIDNEKLGHDFAVAVFPALSQFLIAILSPAKLTQALLAKRDPALAALCRESGEFKDDIKEESALIRWLKIITVFTDRMPAFLENLNSISQSVDFREMTIDDASLLEAMLLQEGLVEEVQKALALIFLQNAKRVGYSFSDYYSIDLETHKCRLSNITKMRGYAKFDTTLQEVLDRETV